MSILKRARGEKPTFRPAVPLTSNSTHNIQLPNENSEENSVKDIIDQMALELAMEGRKPHTNLSNLDRISRNLSVSTSPRQEAEWRYHAHSQNRSLSSFVRIAVDFYIRKHGLK